VQSSREWERLARKPAKYWANWRGDFNLINKIIVILLYFTSKDILALSLPTIVIVIFMFIFPFLSVVDLLDFAG
jgi:hypothetical protein